MGASPTDSDFENISDKGTLETPFVHFKILELIPSSPADVDSLRILIRLRMPFGVIHTLSIKVRSYIGVNGISCIGSLVKITLKESLIEDAEFFSDIVIVVKLSVDQS